MVYKKITLIGRSEDGFEEATQDAIDRAQETLDNVAWVEVVEEGVDLVPDDAEYQSEVEVAFELED